MFTLYKPKPVKIINVDPEEFDLPIIIDLKTNGLSEGYLKYLRYVKSIQMSRHQRKERSRKEKEARNVGQSGK